MAVRLVVEQPFHYSHTHTKDVLKSAEIIYIAVEINPSDMSGLNYTVIFMFKNPNNRLDRLPPNTYLK